MQIEAHNFNPSMLLIQFEFPLHFHKATGEWRGYSELVSGRPHTFNMLNDQLTLYLLMNWIFILHFARFH